MSNVSCTHSNIKIKVHILLLCLCFNINCGSLLLTLDSWRLEPIIPDENASSKSNQTNKKYWIDEGLLHLK